MTLTKPPSTRPQPQGMSVGDVYYVLFRHKWKIAICLAAAIAIAAGMFIAFPPRYQSEAMLFIRYVVTEGRAPGPATDTGTTIKSPDQDGETIMDSEVAILSSLDLARQAAETVGPDKILARSGGGRDLDRAAALVHEGLSIEVVPKSSVIRLTFRHRDPDVTQPVLRAVIDRYLKMHVDIHRPVGIVGDFLNQETEELRTALAQTEDQLRSAYNKAGISSVPDAKKAYAEEIARIQQQIFDTEADLAERSASPQQPEAPAASAAAPKAAAPSPDAPPEQIEQYQALRSQLDSLHATEEQLLAQFTDQNSRVKSVREQIADVDSRLRLMEIAYPQIALAEPEPVKPASGAASPTRPLSVLSTAALQARIKVLNSQLAEVRSSVAKLGQAEGTIEELERRKNLEEANYRYYSASLEQSRINEALGTGRVSNISEIQQPSPPVRELQQFMKTFAGILFLGICAGLGWAFAVEYYLDPSIRRPDDIERTLGLPLFLSIPRIGRREMKALGAGATNGSSPLQNPDAGPGALQPFYETLRDRVMAFFESIDLTHRPKLLAMTGLGRSPGVTTTTTGLARSLAETGAGNVLLVDMTPDQATSREFFDGRPKASIEDIFTLPENAQAQERLYVVSEDPNAKGHSRVLPHRFSKLVPRLKATEFDYIIFDMPPVSQLSITPRLAGFMDMVMLVIESEKTDREVVKHAVSLLERSKTHIGVVLNKTRSYVPSRWHQETLANS
jgi:succinoglycan biosynthesis transport protein ExoP